MLVAQRPVGKAMAGLWEFPGGKLEPGETPEAALRRELREELALDVCCVAPAGFASHAYDDFHLVLMLFVSREWDGRPVGAPVQWLRPAQLYALPMPPADAPLIPQLEAML